MLRRDIIHGQRCVEGENFEIRKTLWKYSWLIEKQRKLIQDWRKEILMEETHPDILISRSPDVYRQLTVKFGAEKLREIEKKITLYHLDQIWADHLEYIADIRESIHLENVGGKTPIIEFQKKITGEFNNLEENIKDQIIETFISLNASKEPIDLDKMGIKGPSSTWTYLINDDQFGSWMELLKGGNIGYAAGAVYLYPVLFLYGIYLHFKNKKQKTQTKNSLKQ
jgi:preprotein translocase subunit SecA